VQGYKRSSLNQSFDVYLHQHYKNGKIRVMKNCFGKWSIILIIIFCLFSAIFYLFIVLGQRGGQGFFSNTLLAFPALIAGISGSLAFIAGSIGIIKDKQRNVFVFLSTAIGFLVLVWCLAEILFPH